MGRDIGRFLCTAGALTLFFCSPAYAQLGATQCYSSKTMPWPIASQISSPVLTCAA